MKMEAAVEISRPIEQVFNYLVVEFAKTYPKLESDVIKIEHEPQGSVGLHTTFHLISSPMINDAVILPFFPGGAKQKEMVYQMTQPTQYIFEVTEYAFNRKFSYKSNGLVKYIPGYLLGYTFASIPGGTKVNCSLEMKPDGLYQKLVLPFVGQISKKNFEQGLVRIKELIEKEIPIE